MDDLVRWLTQVWDEEEAAAKACADVYPSPWDVYDRGWMAKVQADAPDFRHVAELEQHPAIDGWLGVRLEHVARHDPASVLARIAADRKILELHSPTQPAMYLASVPVVVDPSIPSDEIHFRTGKPRCPECGPRDDVEAPCKTVRLLAQPYADHPGYQESWAVQ